MQCFPHVKKGFSFSSGKKVIWDPDKSMPPSCVLEGLRLAHLQAVPKFQLLRRGRGTTVMKMFLLVTAHCKTNTKSLQRRRKAIPSRATQEQENAVTVPICLPSQCSVPHIAFLHSIIGKGQWDLSSVVQRWLNSWVLTASIKSSHGCFPMEEDSSIWTLSSLSFEWWVGVVVRGKI